MAAIRAHVFVSGRVQGVFYRSETQRQAARLNLTGWVRNLPDRRVELIAEGDRESVERLLAWCHEGPPHARVSDVEVAIEPFTGEFKTFTIGR